MAKWPGKTRLIGTRVPRLDGLAKASGRAKYPTDLRPEGMLFGAVLYSPYAHANVKSVDTSAAEKMPGVKAVVVLVDFGTKDEPKVPAVNYQGDDIAAVAAETEEQARDALRAIKVDYEVLPHVVTEAQAMAPGAPKIVAGGNVRKGRATTKGKPEEAMARADATIEATYVLPVITHVCLEPHGLTAKWEGNNKLIAWSSTQAVQVVAGELAEALKLAPTDVTVLTDYMGGGFGSKFGADVWGVAAARLSQKAGGRPVKLFLDREQEHLAGGNRPSAAGRVKLGATKDGKLVAMIADTWGTGGRGGSNFPLPYVYEVPDQSRTHAEVFVNGGSARAMRAPGHPQGCAIMEAAMDDLADKLGIDPLEFRLKNLDEKDFHTPIYRGEATLGAELIGWREHRKPRGRSGNGPIRRGLGVAFHQWGGGGQDDKQVTCTISPDGSVEVKSATQDLGTGARTVLAIIAAELLGLQPTDITPNIGNSNFVPGQPSGGSTTTATMSPPCFAAVTQARRAFFNRLERAIAADPEEMELKDGQLWVDGIPELSWKDACRKIGTMPISETGKYVEGLTSEGVGGVQFVDLTVDIETGVVKLHKIVAIQDSGLIINRQAWESQVYGGVIMGLNYGLFEERIMDPLTGVMLNADLELYKLAGASDIPEIVVRAYEPEEIKARGVIGVGEPPTISTAAAIGNAVTNAIGVRVAEWPMSPRNILNALAMASK